MTGFNLTAGAYSSAAGLALSAARTAQSPSPLCCSMMPAFGYAMPMMAIYELAFQQARETVRQTQRRSWFRRYVDVNPN